jgi:ATP-dependent DNA ligase
MARTTAPKTGRLPEPPVGPDTRPMEALLVDELPAGGGWQYEPKWDGFRCLAFRDGDRLDLIGKSGKPLGRYFPEVVANLLALPRRRFAVDGELVIRLDDSLSFDALQMRLHPAESRIRRLAAETPATFVLFDCLLSARGASLLPAPLETRRAALEEFFAAAGGAAGLGLSPATRDIGVARRWLGNGDAALDGVVAKRLGESYQPGRRAMVKVKRMHTADCVVGGFRYAANERIVGSLLLGLYDAEGRLDHVGFTSGFAGQDRNGLTRKLERLVAPPGFTGDAPGGPSRWSTARSAEWQPLKPKLVAEVRYDHVTGGRFRHGTRFLRWRPDKPPRSCTFDQIAPPVRSGVVAALRKPR